MKTNIFFLFCLTTFGLFGQQESQFASIFQNPYILNPAAGGLSNVAQIDANTRMQWIGYGEGPTTLMLTGHSQLKIGKSSSNGEFNPTGEAMFAKPGISVGSVKHIVGGKIISDAIGPFNKLGVYGSYAIHLPLTKQFNIGVGLGIGYSNFRINQNRVTLYDENDDVYASALGSSSQQNIGDVNAGFVFYGKGLFFGFSTSQILKNKAKFSSVLTNSNYNRHYYFTLNYGIKAGDKMTIEPGVIMKLAENSPMSLDFGARFIYKGSTWLGIYGRTSNSMVFQIGSNLVKNLYVSYAYELATGKIRNAASGTHEIQLGIYLGKNRNVKKESKESVDE